MEYCNGGDLADYLNAKGTLSEDTIRLFLRQLAGAMKALHAKGIVHRDLKPQNILLSHCGKPHPQPHEITLKIADFGFARFLQDGVMAATLCGSPMYMAPEVIMSLQYDAKADLWSLGTIVFQCLTGKAPFHAQTPQALKQFYEKNANLAPKIPAGTSSELADLLLGLLRRNARDRMEFDTFFSHPFLKKSPKSTSPVPVPSRQNSMCSEPSPGSCPLESPGLGNVVPLPSPPLGQLPPSPAPLFLEAAKICDERGGIDFPRVTTPPAGSPVSAKEQESTSSPDEHDDFVLVPANIPSDHSYDSNCSERQRTVDYCEPQQVMKGVSGFPPAAVAAAYPKTAAHLAASPPRPSFLPISEQSHPFALYQSANQASEPIPVPTQKDLYNHIHGSFTNEFSRGGAQSPRGNNNEGLPAPNNYELHHRNTSPSSSPRSPIKSAVPRSEPISMKRTFSNCDSHRGQDMSSLSPPAVQFAMGTPPNGGRRRSTSGSSCGTPPPVTTWQVSPVTQCALSGRHTPTGSPLRRSGTTSPHLVGPLFTGAANILPPILGSPTRLPSPMELDNACYDNSDRCGNIADLCQPPFIPFGTRAMTLPEITGTPKAASLQRRASLGLFHEPLSESLPFGTSPPGMEGPITFIAPELPEETLLEREHNETLAKLNFVLALSDCVVELARMRGTPLSALTESVSRGEPQQPEGCRRAEQLVLLVRALQLLSSGLSLATQELRSGQLQPSSTVKSVVSVLNDKFHYCLNTCKQLNAPGLLHKAGVDPGSTNITADKILYNYAIEMCQSAALDELFGNPHECFQRYQTAQILLHSLAQQVQHDQDRSLLLRYKDAVEKRLYVLQQQGYIYAYDTT